jgi:hypothetical protein
MIVISKKTFGDDNCRKIRGNSTWALNPLGDNYAIVPPDMEDVIFETQGYCDIELNEDGTEVVSFTAREIPKIEEPEQPVTEAEQLRADIDYLAIMTGVTL